MGLDLRTNHDILWFERVRASVGKEAFQCNGHLTTEMYAAVVALDAFAWDADSVDVNEWIRSSSEPLTADIAKFEAARERFLEAAKVDLGTG